MNTHTEIPAGEPTIIMTRVYDAPREMVWQVMTEPEHVRKWWGGPGFTNPVCEMDVRPGGVWKHVMRFPDGRELRLDFVFLEVERPSRLVWEHAVEGPNPRFTSTLEALGRRTRCVMVARFESIAARDAAVGFGFTGPIEASQDRLVDYLATIPSESHQ